MTDHFNKGTAINQPAFPRIYNADCHNGMTLRDWFAAQALSGLVATIKGPGCAAWDYYSTAAYEIADAMLIQRAKKESGDAE